MSFTQALTYYVPTTALGFIVVSLFVAMSIGGLLLVRRLVPHHRLKVHNDVAAAIFNTLGVVYAVLLAFVVVVVWQNFDKTKQNVEGEANYIMDIYRDSSALPESFRTEARAMMKKYADSVINDEWHLVAMGKQSAKTFEHLNKLWAVYASYEPKTEKEKIFFAESVRKLNQAGELRRTRLMDSRAGIHPILWIVLVVGGVTTVSFTFFFGSENLRAQIAMASMLAMLVALILFTILLFDFPFTGALKISSVAFTKMPCF